MPKLAIAGIMIPLSICAQSTTYDYFTFSAPKGWQKEAGDNVLNYIKINNSKKNWARITLIKSTVSKGSPQADFASEWNEFAVKPYNVAEQPQEKDTQTFKGWKMQTGLCKFLFNKDTVSMLLTNFSNGERCISFYLQSNTTSFGGEIDNFIASINLPEASTLANVAPLTPEEPVFTSQPAITPFQYNTTNFDDGWTSIVKEDWVEATKGNIKVLLHYPRAEDKNYYSQYEERVRVFWNLLVAPRYSNLRQYQSPSHLLSFEPGYFAAGLLTDKTTGKDVWVALFNKGKSGWAEVICPDKSTFIKEFRVDEPQLYFDDWDRMLKLFALNKFAIGENDLTGKWSDSFYGATSYYNTVTGMYAGSTSFASTVVFIFNKNKTYKWELGMGKTDLSSNMKSDHAKASGTWKLLNNWQIWFSEIERNPRTYNAYFTCIKGGRILWLQDTGYGGYNAYGKINN